MELTQSRRRPSFASDEESLVVAARAGDDRAFEQLYAAYRDRIFGFILGRVRDHGRAEDIAQDVFVSALRQIRASEGRIAFKPWLYTIARNACIDEFRRGARSPEVALDAGEELGETAEAPLLSGIPTPVAAIESKQKLEDLRGAFGGLSQVQHRLLVMRELEGLTYDEIGERLGMTRQMVESGLFRARRRLGEEYEELASGRRCTEIQGAIEAGRLSRARGLGIKERRRCARHLAHCQPCRHQALLTGIDKSLLTAPRSLPARIGALLPFPLLRPWRWGRRGAHAASGHATGAVSAGVASSAAGSSVPGGQAAVLAALALAGAGGGVVAAVDHHAHHPSRPAVVTHQVRPIQSVHDGAPGRSSAPPAHGAGSGTTGSRTGASQPSAAGRRARAHPQTTGRATRGERSSPARTVSDRSVRHLRGRGAATPSGTPPAGANPAPGSPGLGGSSDPGSGPAGSSTHGDSSTVRGIDSTAHGATTDPAGTLAGTIKHISTTIPKTVSSAGTPVGPVIHTVANPVIHTVKPVIHTVVKPVLTTAGTTLSTAGKTLTGAGTALGGGSTPTPTTAGSTTPPAGVKVPSTPVTPPAGVKVPSTPVTPPVGVKVPTTTVTTPATTAAGTVSTKAPSTLSSLGGALGG